jgi:peroxiredoxin
LVLYQVIGQNGRMLDRLDSLERRSRSRFGLAQSHIERDGLPAGTPAPLFELPDIAGSTVSLAGFRDRRVLLVFSDPNCGPCDQVAPHLVRLHREQSGSDLSIVMIGRGDRNENRRKAQQHGFEFPVAVQRRWEISKQYGIFATPVAFLIGKDGVITHNVARGVDEILALVPNGAAVA